MVRHRTPRTRRRSQKRRLQLGGVESVLTRYPTLDALNTAIGTAVSRGTLAIPSQKRGICVTDAVVTSIWYSDYLGEWLWAKYIYSRRRPGIDTADAERQGLIEPTDAIDSFMRLSALRVVNIMQQGAEVPIWNGLLARQPSAQPVAELPTGEVCSNILASLAKAPDVPVQTYLEDRPSHGISSNYTSEALRGILERITPAGSALVSPYPCQGKTCVAILLTSAIHAVACVLVNGIWHFMDNEVGIAIPLRGITLRQLESSSFSFTYDLTHPEHESFHLYLNSNAWRGGQLGSWTVNRVYERPDAYIGNTIPHQETLETRRYICVNPEALRGDGGPHRMVVDMDVPEIAPAPRQRDLRDIVGVLAGVRFFSKADSGRTSYITTESEQVVFRVTSVRGPGSTYTIRYGQVVIGVFTPNDMRRPTNSLWKVKLHTDRGEEFEGILDLRDSAGVTSELRGMMRLLLTTLSRENQQADVPMSAEPPPPPSRPAPAAPAAPVLDTEEGYRMALEEYAAPAQAPAPPAPAPPAPAPPAPAPAPLGWSPATQVLAQLVQRRPDPDLYDEIVNVIRDGGDLNQKNESGLTPFHALVRTKRDLFSVDPTRIQTLVNSLHADVNTRDLQANTVFHTVAQRYTSDEMEAILPQLIELTRDINARNNVLDTPLDVVLKRRDRTDAMVAVFMKYGGRPSTQRLPTGGRRKTFRRRRSSSPTRTGPSSGHSRRYSRRRRASRS